MKIVLLAFCVLLISSMAVYAQANKKTDGLCADKDCIDKEFKYLFCAPGARSPIEKCSKDPNNDLPYRPAKKAIPQTLCLDLSNQHFTQIYVKEPGEDTAAGAKVIIYSATDVEAILRQAMTDWCYFLCPAQGPNPEYQACCVKVKYSSNPEDFYPFPVDQARATTCEPVDGTVGRADYCQIKCDVSGIFLNNNADYTKPNAFGAPTQYLFTRNKEAIPDDYHYASLYSILLHELGHWFGLGHSENVKDVNGHICKSNGGSIMEPGYIGKWEGVDRKMNDDDACAFMKLYCCEKTLDKMGVDGACEIARKGRYISVVPNPTLDNVISIQLLNFSEREATTLKVLNVTGEVVMRHDVSSETRLLALDISGLANGVYFVEIIHDKGTAAQKLVIQR